MTVDLSSNKCVCHFETSSADNQCTTWSQNGAGSQNTRYVMFIT